MTNNEIAKHVSEQTAELNRIMEDYTPSAEKEIKAIYDGLVDLLKREGFSDVEIEHILVDFSKYI